ncbi:hypothetical protein QR98_0044150 [Sarcoptes scabiei]|uniref:Uncharacterized protein n=1 Tax=Sarcoptes scabiei TaxID=52283 RepID=A0A132A4P7_SARSC|nr:hypothetical protein QR98_0044150 [Sarcoptes scabiei]
MKAKKIEADYLRPSRSSPMATSQIRSRGIWANIALECKFFFPQPSSLLYGEIEMMKERPDEIETCITI